MGVVVTNLNGESRPFTEKDVESFGGKGQSSFGEALGATFQKNNIIGSTYNSLMGDSNIATDRSAYIDDNQNGRTRRQGLDIGMGYYNKALGKGYSDEEASILYNARNDKQFDATIADIDNQRKNNEIISRGSFPSQLASELISGVADPLNFVPVFGVASKIKAISKVGKIGKEALEVGVSAGVTNLASEAILTQQQSLRSQEKGMFFDNSYLDALTGGMVVGSVLGGGVSALRKERNMTPIQKGLGREAQNFDDVYGQVSTFGSSSASSAEVKKTTLEEEGISGGKYVQGLARFVTGKADPTTLIENKIAKTALAPVTGVLKGTSGIVGVVVDNPVLGALQSPFKVAREVAQQIADSGLKIKKGEQGVAVAKGGTIESLNKLTKAPVISSTVDGKTLFLQYRDKEAQLFGSIRSEIEDVTNMNGDLLTEREFFEQVGRSMVREDKHENSFVQKTAEIFRKNVFDPLLKESQELGLLPENMQVKTAKSYLTRVYDSFKIKSDKDKFINISRDWLRDVQINNAQIQANIISLNDVRIQRLKDKISTDDIDEQIKKNIKNWQGRTSDDFVSEKIDIDEAIRAVIKKETRLSDDELRITASEIADQILSTPDGRLGYSNKDKKSSGGGASQDELTPSPFKSRAFMIPDELIEDFLVKDIRVIANRYASSVGSYLNMYKRFDGDVDLLQAKRDIMYEANKMIADNPENSRQIQADAERAIRNISALRDRALGRDYLPNDPTSTPMRVSKSIRQLNVITMLGGVVKSSVVDLGRLVLAGDNVFKNATKVFTLKRSASLKRDEQMRLGVVAELVSNNTYLQLNDIGDSIVPNTKLEKSIQWLSDKFGYVSGLTYWQQAMKQITAMSTEDTIIRRIQEVIKKPNELTDSHKVLAQNGIDVDMAKQIFAEFEKHGENFKGVNLLNGDKWENKDALKSLLSAIVSETDRIIVTPGYDKSVNINSNALFVTMAQFKSFFLSATTKILMRGMQDEFTTNNMVSFGLMMGLGMLIYAGKTVEAGKELSDNPAVWLIEGFDRAGIGGIFTEVNNISEKAFGLGARPFVGGSISSRYQSRSVADSLLGPSFGRFVNTISLVRGIREGELTNQDINTIMSLVPYQNTPLMTETGINRSIKEALGKDN